MVEQKAGGQHLAQSQDGHHKAEIQRRGHDRAVQGSQLLVAASMKNQRWEKKERGKEAMQIVSARKKGRSE